MPATVKPLQLVYRSKASKTDRLASAWITIATPSNVTLPEDDSTWFVIMEEGTIRIKLCRLTGRLSRREGMPKAATFETYLPHFETVHEGHGIVIAVGIRDEGTWSIATDAIYVGRHVGRLTPRPV